MRVPRRLIAAALVLGVVAPCATRAQERGAVAFDQAVRGLTTTGRVLVIGAHPDDEDTFLIAWLARGRQVETAYLALTRGDGGQNIIGNELGEALGALRTEELLAARRLDGAHQYFSRAYDFGFSKNAEETYKHWDHDSLLGDVVTVVRAFRPQVVVAIFSGTPADGHGHHQVSGLLAKEAFDLAGDTVRFPAAKYGQPWVPSKFYRNARFGRGPRTLTFDVGAYDPVMGRSDAEIAGESRSQHRSQGQGTPQPKGVSVTGVSRVETRVNESTPATAEQSLFDGVDTTFARLVAEAPDSVRAALRAVGAMADSALAAADLRHPERALPQLARATELLQRAVKVRHCGFPSEGFRRTPAAVPCDAAAIDLDASLAIMERRFERAVLAASGVALEATAERELLAFGDSMPVTVSVYNRSHGPVSISNIRLSGTHPRVAMPITVEADSTARTQVNVIGLVDKRPWWIGGRVGDMFPPHQAPEDGLARLSTAGYPPLVPAVSLPEDSRRETDAALTLGIAGATVDIALGPIVYKFVDRVLGEERHPAGGVPPVTMAFDDGLEWVQAGKPIDRRIRLSLKSYAQGPRTLSFRLVSPPGVRVDSLPPSITLAAMEEKELFLRLRGTLSKGRYEFGIIAETETGKSYEGITTIDYPHIRPINLYHSSAFYIQAVDIAIPATLSVAYVQGVGDVVAPYLRQLGIPVMMLSPEELAVADLARFSTLVIGPRAYEAHRELVTYNSRILDFARKGGTVVVQYGQGEMTRPGIMPYPIGLTQPAARVTVEDVPVTVLDARSRVVSGPNKIGDADWADWVQERALYMPTTIDPHYATPLEMHDPGEPENKGAVLVTPLGKGMYVYTTLSLLRQIPGGIPGGPRLFVNLLSVGLDQPKKVTP
ncbi:MAG: PIG-L family deacetylase [Gemmatimonadetes bacterium]|nr:PIG-L family deacetylase [Gemmatimonadota bacterium]